MKDNKNNVIPLSTKRAKVVKMKEPLAKRINDLKKELKAFHDILNKKD